jgi:hypothetical protein
MILASVVHLFVAMPDLAGDAAGYDRMARGLVGEDDLHWSFRGLAPRGYLYPGFLAAVYALGGGPEIASWIQGVVFLPLTTLLVYVAGRLAFSRPVGLVAAWCCALWLPAAWHTQWLLTETLLGLLTAALAALLAGTLVRRSENLAALGGLVAGLVSISHPAYQFLWIVLLAAVIAVIRPRRLIMAFAIGIGAVLSPYWAFSTAADAPRLGQAVGSGLGGGYTFYVGSRWQTDFTTTAGDRIVADYAHELETLGALLDAGAIDVEPTLEATIREKLARPGHETLTDRDFYAAGVTNLLERPDRLPLKLRRNASTLFVLQPDPRLGDPARTEAIWLRSFWRPASVLLALLAVAGSAYVLGCRRDRLLIFVPPLFQTMVFMASHTEARYAIPLWPYVFLLGAVALQAGSAVRVSASTRRWIPARRPS